MKLEELVERVIELIRDSRPSYYASQSGVDYREYYFDKYRVKEMVGAEGTSFRLEYRSRMDGWKFRGVIKLSPDGQVLRVYGRNSWSRLLKRN